MNAFLTVCVGTTHQPDPQTPETVSQKKTAPILPMIMYLIGELNIFANCQVCQIYDNLTYLCCCCQLLKFLSQFAYYV